MSLTGKKALICIGQYNHLGGAETQALRLGTILASKGCEVEFIAWGGDGVVSQLVHDSGFVCRVFDLKWSNSRGSRILAIFRLGLYLRTRVKPDFLLPFIGFNSMVLILAKPLSGATFCWWNQRDEGRGVNGSAWERLAISKADLVVSNSLEGRDFLSRVFGIDPDSVEILNNAVVVEPNDGAKEVRRRLNVSQEAIILLMVANLTPFKDHETLIRAFALLRDSSDDEIHLVLVGRMDSETLRLKALCFDLNLGGVVHFEGAKLDTDSYYGAADIIVHSSDSEGCPNAVLEGMAHGKPVCGTDIFGMRQALGGSDLLVPSKSPSTLAQVMGRLVADPGLRMHLGQINRARAVEFFSVERLSNEVDRILEPYS